jgi:hypothetical protein
MASFDIKKIIIEKFQLYFFSSIFVIITLDPDPQHYPDPQQVPNN